ncbi:LysR family transcriptional regulator [Sphingomonas parva]|uniref:LysR family transcriptional regulator n=1 Tax=Sphingomonas parva TaxID=2555898 RepID=A0A4Y8ZN28_9SPHN|nr:LysR family transcriptional regulator [Sphingomonas parva]TFI57364.1 LysR family transcriptional regulator [Sphingomonas parva]
MIRPYLPLNALRAFEAAARHLSFTKAAIELSVTPAALSHQVKGLEERLGKPLFHRLPRGLALTDEALGLLPVVRDSFDRMAEFILRLQDGGKRQILSVGVVGTFAVKWLLPRLARFREAHDWIDLRLSTNNNRVDLAEEGLHMAIRFGDGAWHGTDAIPLFDAPATPLCDARTASRLAAPEDLRREVLLRSYRADEWPAWFAAAGLECPPLTGPVFDSAALMVEAALSGEGVALAFPRLFGPALAAGSLRRPFHLTITTGSYWLTRLKSARPSEAGAAFEAWLLDEAARETSQPG